MRATTDIAHRVVFHGVILTVDYVGQKLLGSLYRDWRLTVITDRLNTKIEVDSNFSKQLLPSIDLLALMMHCTYLIIRRNHQHIRTSG